jgi:hypothetical protein
MTMMNLSLSFCPPLTSPPAPAQALWHQLNATSGKQPELNGHHALTTVFEETEWMIITGGETDHTTDSRFHVWLMNLTHADLFGEEQWLVMDGGEDGRSGSACTPFVYNSTLDPWERSDLWKQSVKCAPSPRSGHLSAVVNDELFVFQGYADEAVDQDYGVYRIPLSKVVSNKWVAWRRILPRDLLDSTSTVHASMKGGLWYQNVENRLPRLVAFASRARVTPSENHGWDFSPKKVANEVWAYDFTEDSWELWYEQSVADFDSGDYSAVVVRQNLFIVGSYFNGAAPILSVNLETKEDSFSWDTEGLMVPRQTLVTYEDERTGQSVIVGFGPMQHYFSSRKASNLAMVTVEYNLEGKPIEIPPVRIDASTTSPGARIEHSAVLSSAGNMYIYGGYDVKSAGVWHINVGGKECNLKYRSKDPTSFDPYDLYLDDAFSDDDQDDSGSGFIMFMFIFVQFGLCFVGGNQRQRRDGQQHATTAPLRGLTPEELEAFPQRVLCESDEQLGEENVCSICLLDFYSGEEVRDLPCKHFFHKACVDSWLAAETTCPLCRVSCRPTAAEELFRPPPHVAAMLQMFRRDDREAVDTHDADEEAGLEMRSVYSLELQEEQSGDDGGVLSTRAVGQQSSSESTNESRERQGRRNFSGSRGEGSVPLTAAARDAAIV